MHSPDFAEHCAVRKGESYGEQPGSRLADGRVGFGGDEVAVQTEEVDAGQADYDAAEHYRVANWVGGLDHPGK